MRPATPQELARINLYAERELNHTFDADKVAVFDRYFPDCPGFFGKLVVAIGGQSTFVNTFAFRPDDSLAYVTTCEHDVFAEFPRNPV